jgi:trehalose synthase
MARQRPATRGSVKEVDVGTFPLARFESVVTPGQFRHLMAAVREVGPVLGGRTIWNINSTARGGGVAEMLKSLMREVPASTRAGS